MEARTTARARGGAGAQYARGFSLRQSTPRALRPSRSSSAAGVAGPVGRRYYSARLR